MSMLEDLLAGGSDYHVVLDLGGAVFAPVGDTREEQAAFHEVARRIIANEGLGYRVHTSHRSSDDADRFFDRVVINID